MLQTFLIDRTGQVLSKDPREIILSVPQQLVSGIEARQFQNDINLVLNPWTRFSRFEMACGNRSAKSFFKSWEFLGLL